MHSSDVVPFFSLMVKVRAEVFGGGMHCCSQSYRDFVSRSCFVGRLFYQRGWRWETARQRSHQFRKHVAVRPDRVRSLTRPFASSESSALNDSVFFTRSLTDRLADFMVYKSSRAQLQRMDDVIRYLKTVPVWSEYGESRVL